MKKIKLPLEMASGAMVRTIDELKENWDLTKVVEHFVSGKLVTWLNDRYYSDIAEKLEALPKDGDSCKLQQALCKAFEMPCEELELDVDEIAERNRRRDLLRQYTSDEKILDNVDKVAFDQEDLSYLLDEGVAEIYLCNNKFTIPLSVTGKKYVGVGSVEVNIGKKGLVDFKQLGIEFTNVKFDAQYEVLLAEKKVEEEKQKQAELAREKAMKAKKVGDIIVLGEWHSEPIEWYILDVKDGNALLLSRYVLELELYETSKRRDVTWENCTIRQWLNGEFFNKAFQQLPEEIILKSIVKPHCNPDYGGTVLGNETKDRVFFLSVKEALQYLTIFKTNEDKMCYPKPWVKCELPICSWWLRTPGWDNIHVADVDGGIFGVRSSGSCSDVNGPNGVRPACWIDLSKLE